MKYCKIMQMSSKIGYMEFWYLYTRSDMIYTRLEIMDDYHERNCYFKIINTIMSRQWGCLENNQYQNVKKLGCLGSIWNNIIFVKILERKMFYIILNGWIVQWVHIQILFFHLKFNNFCPKVAIPSSMQQLLATQSHSLMT